MALQHAVGELHGERVARKGHNLRGGWREGRRREEGSIILGDTRLLIVRNLCCGPSGVEMFTIFLITKNIMVATNQYLVAIQPMHNL